MLLFSGIGTLSRFFGGPFCRITSALCLFFPPCTHRVRANSRRLRVRDGIVYGSYNTIEGYNLIVVGSRNIIKGNMIRAYGADNLIVGDHSLNVDTGKHGSCRGDCSFRVTPDGQLARKPAFDYAVALLTGAQDERPPTPRPQSARRHKPSPFSGDRRLVKTSDLQLQALAKRVEKKKRRRTTRTPRLTITEIMVSSN